MEELVVLGRWREAFSREELDVRFALVSVDEASAPTELEAWSRKPLPGPIQWLRSEANLGPLLDGLGVERDASIPIHALVDLRGQVRCVRVGAVHEQGYGSARDLLPEAR